MTSSAITKEEAARHPEAVLDVLQFYTQQQLGNKAPTSVERSATNHSSAAGPSEAAASRFEGIGLAGHRLQGEHSKGALVDTVREDAKGSRLRQPAAPAPMTSRTETGAISQSKEVSDLNCLPLTNRGTTSDLSSRTAGRHPRLAQGHLTRTDRQRQGHLVRDRPRRRSNRPHQHDRAKPAEGIRRAPRDVSAL